ncbi:progesterone binding protein [Fomitiporia mediterranea MF3/22]|uniref:progesterone binding protein n=1 Tax=Fomitiporia mediterranea (strain MF3/22) TaxID=694068 RepID=UPI0004409628|nr:progesterone binding protein [Fomitiporia mediterranea MF3/22]EJD02678.1 progesterone binding protein [Fomitiporia mediterranea MF3/22]
MQAENPELLPPSDKPFRLEELKPFDGKDPEKPIYVSIKGTIFDVTRKREMYGPGKSYNIFAGKDGSRGLGMSSLKDEDAVPDFHTLPPNEMKVLDDWHAFFSKRYNIVGLVTDMPEAVAHLCPSPTSPTTSPSSSS